MNFDNSIQFFFFFTKRPLLGSMKWPHFDDFGKIYCFYVVTSIKLFIFISIWGNLWMKTQLFHKIYLPVNMQNYLFYQQNPAILIFLAKCNFKNFMLWKWKSPIFEKQLFLSITFPFIDVFTLNFDEFNDFLKFWPLVAFFGLHWAFLPLLALDEFFKQRPAFGDKN